MNNPIDTIYRMLLGFLTILFLVMSISFVERNDLMGVIFFGSLSIIYAILLGVKTLQDVNVGVSE